MTVFRFLDELSALVNGLILGKSAVSAAGKLGYLVASLALDGVATSRYPVAATISSTV